MWKINGANDLMNKAGVWKSRDKWTFRSITSTKVYVENNSNKTRLAVADDETTVIEEAIENNAGQVWDIGIPSKDGYFTLTMTNMSKGLLTASSTYDLKIKGE